MYVIDFLIKELIKKFLQVNIPFVLSEKNEDYLKKINLADIKTTEKPF